jgi:hypothetical protein
MQSATPTSWEARTSLREWLEANRLVHHERKIIELAGPGFALSDLVSCTEEEIGSFAATMTSVEARRFEFAVATLSRDANVSAAPLASSE